MNYNKPKEQLEIKPFSIEQSVDEAIQEMVKEKQDNPDLIIPYSFLDYYNRPEMFNLLSTAYEYSKSLVSFNSTFLIRKKEGKHNGPTNFSERHSAALTKFGKIVAKKYGELILKQKGLISSSDDQNFFETVIYFIIKVIKSGTSSEHWDLIEDELNRLFRSTAFNFCQRKKDEKDQYVRFPQLKPHQKRDTESIISGIMIRSNLQKLQVKSHSFDGISRPAFVRISPYKAIYSRSPLISMLLPSPKDRIRQFEELRRKVLGRKQNTSNRYNP